MEEFRKMQANTFWITTLLILKAQCVIFTVTQNVDLALKLILNYLIQVQMWGIKYIQIKLYLSAKSHTTKKKSEHQNSSYYDQLKS